MRQWKTISADEDILDNRTKRDIWERIQNLADAYTPEWQFGEQDPDIGSVLALLFADRMQENIDRYNMTLLRYLTELVNLAGISRRPANPAHSVVLMDMVQDTIAGQKLPAGTKLLAEGEKGIPFVFETAHGIYITRSRLQYLFMASGITGKVIPLKGDFAPVTYIEGDGESFEKQEAAAFTLFDFSGEGYGKTGLVMYHSHIFDEADGAIRMEISGGCGLAEAIIRGDYRLSYYGKEGFQRITDMRIGKDGCLVFKKDGACRKVRLEEGTYSALLLEPAGVVEKNVTVGDIRFGASGGPTAAAYVLNGGAELPVEAFYPFGRALSLFAELYIGHRYFGQSGARVTVAFELSFEEAAVSAPAAEKEELKIIKRRPPRDLAGTAADVYAEEVAFSYYNGTGWRKLTLETPAESIFGGGKAGAYKISFICPEDWQETETGGYTGKCIRLQLLRADNCYYHPAVHHCPIVRHLRIGYNFDDRFVRPQKLISFQGSQKRDITESFAKNDRSTILLSGSYHETSLYLGFDRKMEDGPVGIWFLVRAGGNERKGRVLLSYSTRLGFSKLKAVDHTDGLCHSGSILFMPPADMAARTIEGIKAYWIRITDDAPLQETEPADRPVIEAVAVNAVEADNIETLPQESYYLDNCGPNMVFPVEAVNILGMDVWVNETAEHTDGEMRRFLQEHPADTRAEYDAQGKIVEFYVKWREVDHFDGSRPDDRHYVLDRAERRLRFGDGVNVRIPRCTAGPAFQTVVRCCDGKRANVPAGSVNDTKGNVMFIENIHNPVNAYGGMDMETAEDALRRGTVMLNSRGRLISTLDYEREALDFSHSISQAKVVTGVKKDGTVQDGSVSVVVLMEDYLDGPASFLALGKRLREHLLSRCEMTVTPALLEIVEPLYVEISVEAWVRTADTDDGFQVRHDLMLMLRDYLDPVKNNNWEIGGGVTESQIRQRLNREKKSALIRRVLISGRYRDGQGWHEAELKSLDSPYMLVVSGAHKIHVE